MYSGAYAAQTPDRPAAILHETGERLTYAELEERSVRLSRLLYDAGLRIGGTIALAAKTAEAQHPKHPRWTTTSDVGYSPLTGQGSLRPRPPRPEK
jgi:non-ribosomal peptide synthetase component F